MFLRKKNSNKEQIIKKVKNYQIKPSFIEKNIIIPNIINQMNTISLLFKEMEEIYNQLQDESNEYAQDFKKDLTEMVITYNKTKFITDDPIIIKQMEDEAKNEAKRLREMLLNGISIHLDQYLSLLNNLGQISPKEDRIETISEYMIKAKSFMSNIIQLKKKIFNIVIPMTTVIITNPKTKKEIKRLPVDHPMETIGLLPFETRIDEIALLCENGIKSIDSWFDHLKNRKVQYLETIVNQSKVQAAQEQAKAAKWTFYTQLGFMILSVLFIIVSVFLANYKEDWIDFLNKKQSVKKPLVEGDVKMEKLPIDNNINGMEKELIPNELKEAQPVNKSKIQK